MNQYKTYGQRLLYLLQEKDMSQSDLARVLKITPAAISLYVSDRRLPKIPQAVKIAKALGTSVEWMYCGGTR